MLDLELFDRMFNRQLEPKIPSMKADIIETDTSYIAKLDVPGFNENEITVDIKNGDLVIKAQKEDKVEEGTIVKERHTQLVRTFYLDGKVDVDSITAELEQGVLTITANKTKERQPQSINIIKK